MTGTAIVGLALAVSLRGWNGEGKITRSDLSQRLGAEGIGTHSRTLAGTEVERNVVEARSEAYGR